MMGGLILAAAHFHILKAVHAGFGDIDFECLRLPDFWDASGTFIDGVEGECRIGMDFGTEFLAGLHGLGGHQVGDVGCEGVDLRDGHGCSSLRLVRF